MTDRENSTEQLQSPQLNVGQALQSDLLHNNNRLVNLQDMETLHGTHIIASIVLSKTIEFEEKEPISPEINWYTAKELNVLIPKGNSWLQKRLPLYEQTTVHSLGSTGRYATRYPFWVLDVLMAEAETANTRYPDAGDSLGIETMARMLNHTDDWVIARLEYLQIEGEMMLDKQKRAFIHYPPESVAMIAALPEDILLANNYNRWTEVSDTDIIRFYKEKFPQQRVTYRKIADIRREDKSAPGIGLVVARFGSIQGLNNALVEVAPSIKQSSDAVSIEKMAIRTARPVDAMTLSLAELYKKEPYVPVVIPVDADPLAWRASGLCVQTDPEAFFPERGESNRMAKKICQMCEVKVQCLDYALENNERFGVWGGLSEQERRQLQVTPQTA